MAKVLKSSAEIKTMVEADLHEQKHCKGATVVIGPEGPPEAHGWTVSHAEAFHADADHQEIEAVLRMIVPPLQAKYSLA